MFCPKCGTQNPEAGQFCRSCGTDLGNVSQALAGNFVPVPPVPVVDHKGRSITYEIAVVNMFSGLGFVALAIALAFTMGGAWWFWLLAPAVGCFGFGALQYFKLKRSEKENTGFRSVMRPMFTPYESTQALPPSQTSYVSPESPYKTDDLVPPSVTDNTTRDLEMDTEGKTIPLPKK